MTVTTTHTENTFTPNGSQTVFSFTFTVIDATHIEVSIDGVVKSPSLYTVTLAQSRIGGTVTFATAPTGTTGKIKRVTPKTQLMSLLQEAKLDSEALELAVDKLVLIMQEVAVGVTGPPGPQGPQGPPGQNGQMTGPASSTDGAIVIWNGTSGTTVKNGPAPTPNGSILKVVNGAWAASAASAAIPSGLVALWPFDPAVVAIPTGWALCNGQTVMINGVPRATPDSRGKYLLCAAVDDTDSSGYTGSTVRPGQIAGTKTHQHGQGGTISIGATFVTGSVTVSPEGFLVNGGTQAQVGADGTYSINTNAHNHSASISGNTQDNTESTRPIEVGLLLIIKVDE